MTLKNKKLSLPMPFGTGVLILLLVIGLGSFGCNGEAVENLVQLTANPEEVVTGQQVRLTVNILNAEEDGYDISFTAATGEIQGGNDYQVMSTRLTVVYNPEPYYGNTYRLDQVSVDVSSLSGKFIGSDTVTVKVKAGD